MNSPADDRNQIPSEQLCRSGRHVIRGTQDRRKNGGCAGCQRAVQSRYGKECRKARKKLREQEFLESITRSAIAAGSAFGSAIDLDAIEKSEFLRAEAARLYGPDIDMEQN